MALPSAKTWALDSVCSGSPVPQAAAYDPGRKGKRRVHPVYFPSKTMSSTTQDLPAGFPRQRDRAGDAADYELVACATALPAKKRRECRFMNGNVLELYDGEMEVAVYEAKTAKLVEKKTFKASSSGGCPTYHTFKSNRDPYLKKIESGLAEYIDGLEGGGG